MNPTCGCCAGVERLTPLAIANRPGLAAVDRRIGTHATFFASMVARLSTMEGGSFPLAALTTRAPDDPTLALLDAWATVADVLTFYQERIANEGYLRTATERLSILELARLVGYRWRPGVAASVFLAYTLEEGARVTIPAGSRVQSLPGPGELPQPFETGASLEARAEWNDLAVRLARPHVIKKAAANLSSLYLAGTATNLRPNDALLLVFGAGLKDQEVKLIENVEPDPANARTRVTLQMVKVKDLEFPEIDPKVRVGVGVLVKPLLLRPAALERSPARLNRTVADIFGVSGPSAGRGGTAPVTGAVSDVAARVLVNFQPTLAPTLYAAWAAAPVTPPAELKLVSAFRATAHLFGHNAPLQPTIVDDDRKLYALNAPPTIVDCWKDLLSETGETARRMLVLDRVYDAIVPGSWVAIQPPRKTGAPEPAAAHRVKSVQTVTLSCSGVTARVTVVKLKGTWLGRDWKDLIKNPAVLRGTTVFGESEPIALADEPIADDVAGQTIELRRLYDGLESGRWLIVTGERTDVKSSEAPDAKAVPGIRGCELMMLASAQQRAGGPTGEVPGDTTHTVLQFSQELAFTYRRDTVKIFGNVVKATHGETRFEILGSGDGGKGLQQFELKQHPVTYVATATPDGATSTLRVWVNDVEWHEVRNLSELGPTDRCFVARTDDEDATTVVFGTGEHGARLPTWIENVRARYRSGIGAAGNVAADQLTLLATRPLGVKGVGNPLRASGGADPESRDQARRNAPLAVLALDRLVSVSDFADFARTFAGVGKAAAARLSNGHRELVHVTIAGADDAPVDEQSDLVLNLRRALRAAGGDPFLPIHVEGRELLALVLSAKVAISPDYEWDVIAPKLRAALLRVYGFEQRGLGEDAVLSRIIQTVHAVEGVRYIDVDVFGAIEETIVDDDGQRRVRTPSEIVDEVRRVLSAEHVAPRVVAGLATFDRGTIRPARIAYFLPDAADTLILNPVLP